MLITNIKNENVNYEAILLLIPKIGYPLGSFSDSTRGNEARGRPLEGEGGNEARGRPLEGEERGNEARGRPLEGEGEEKQ